MLLPHKVFAETEEIMSTTQEKFNISGFIKEAEQYMWAQLEKKFNDEHLYVWMIKKDNDTFRNIAFRIKVIFDTVVAKSLKNKTI